MDKIYQYVGMVTTWLIIAVVCLLFIYGLVILTRTFYLFARTRNFIDYYISGGVIETSNLREVYKSWPMKNRHKKYVLLYRLRNIKNARKPLGRINYV